MPSYNLGNALRTLALQILSPSLSTTVYGYAKTAMEYEEKIRLLEEQVNSLEDKIYFMTRKK